MLNRILRENIFKNNLDYIPSFLCISYNHPLLCVRNLGHVESLSKTTPHKDLLDTTIISLITRFQMFSLRGAGSCAVEGKGSRQEDDFKQRNSTRDFVF